MQTAFAHCPIEITLAVLGGKYKTIILFHLLKGPRRYKELQREIFGVSQRMLTLHLRELERDGLLARHQYDEKPPRVEYSITALGRTLETILESMNEWGKQRAAR